MKKALMFASVASMIQQFNMENIRLLLSQGYRVEVACNMEQGSTISPERIREMKQELEGMGVAVHHIPVPRKITRLGQIWKSIFMTKRLMNENGYELIHCHSPIGGMICRLANRLSKNYRKSRMLYTAHGFHFFKGAPAMNWLLFYPVERICARWTDTLITINREDYALAKRKMKAKEVVYVPGVGVSLSRFGDSAADVQEVRERIGVGLDSMVMLSVGELSVRKNHELVIRAMGELQRNDLEYVICGQGSLREALEEVVAACKLQGKVHFLGYRRDIADILKAADFCALPSLQEGLPVALMESMAAGKAVVCSQIRGNTDLIDDKGGFLFDPHSVPSCRTAIAALMNADLQKLGTYNREKIRQFSTEQVQKHMEEIYEKRL